MNQAIGIDIGGTGIKGAVVNYKAGTLESERVRVETPKNATPKDVVTEIKTVLKNLPGVSNDLAIGICFPGVVKNGVTMSAANVSDEWLNFNADKFFEKELKRSVHLINDADAAGVAEMKFGAGRNQKGLVVMVTLGTGIGTAVFNNGKLVPNAELGHLEIDGVDYETLASFAAKEREGLTFEEWSERLTKYFSKLCALLSPDLVIIGGGVSKEHEKFLPFINAPVKFVPAETRNSAGIIGAALVAAKNSK
jgi:polyphosphate glucokinase